MKAGCWVVVRPIYNSLGQVKSFHLDRITKGYPQSLHNGEQAFHMEVTLPEQVFRPLAEVSVVVPQAALVEPQVEVEVG